MVAHSTQPPKQIDRDLYSLLYLTFIKNEKKRVIFNNDSELSYVGTDEFQIVLLERGSSFTNVSIVVAFFFSFLTPPIMFPYITDESLISIDIKNETIEFMRCRRSSAIRSTGVWACLLAPVLLICFQNGLY